MAANGQGPDAAQQLTITVSPPAAPTAVAHTYSTRSGVALRVPSPGLLVHDTGASALHAVLVTGSAHGGAVAVAADGSFTYTPTRGFVGSDTFTYEAVDQDGPPRLPQRSP